MDMFGGAGLMSLSGGGGGDAIAKYSSVSDLPMTAVPPGTMAYVYETATLYLRLGLDPGPGGWYRVAAVNDAPVVLSAVPDLLMLRGTEPLTLSLAVSDPEGMPVTMSAQTERVGGGDPDAILTVQVTGTDLTFTPTPDGEEGMVSISATLTDGLSYTYVSTAVARVSVTPRADTAQLLQLSDKSYVSTYVTGLAFSPADTALACMSDGILFAMPSSGPAIPDWISGSAYSAPGFKQPVFIAGRDTVCILDENGSIQVLRATWDGAEPAGISNYGPITLPYGYYGALAATSDGSAIYTYRLYGRAIERVEGLALLQQVKEENYANVSVSDVTSAFEVPPIGDVAGLHVTDDETRVYLLVSNHAVGGGALVEYRMDTPGDLSTATLVSVGDLSLEFPPGVAANFAFSTSHRRLFVTSTDMTTVAEYEVSE